MKNKYNINDFKFHYNIETRWKDLDAFQHINNAVYATYIESARVDFLKDGKYLEQIQVNQLLWLLLKLII